MAEGFDLGVRFGLYAVLGLLFGLSAFALYALRPAERAVLRLRRRLPGLSAVGVALSGIGLVLLGASMAGVPADAVDAAILTTVLAIPGIGTSVVVRVGLLLLLAMFASGARSETRAAAAGATLGGAGLATLAWGGHAAAAEGATRALHLLADALHLLSAGAWIGALAGLLVLMRAGADDHGPASRALAGFSTAGSLLVAMLIVTGGVNLWILVGPDGLGRLPSTPYGRALLLKLGLFAGMLIVAGFNRFHLVPRLAADATRAAQAARRSVAVEAALGVAILAVVAWFGRLAPPSTP